MFVFVGLDIWKVSWSVALITGYAGGRGSGADKSEEATAACLV